MSRKYPQVYLDITIGTKPAGRVVFELFTDLTPKTAENFRGLCTGEYGHVGMGTRTKRLSYMNAVFHRVVEGFVIQGGDIINGDGSGGASIYGNTFADENFNRKHACAGLLSMANRGRNTNSSQFFVTLKACPHLDGKHVVFGQVIDGMEAIRKIAKVPVDIHDKPKIPIVIVDCGEVNSNRDVLKYDPFHKQEGEVEAEKKEETNVANAPESDKEESEEEEREVEVSETITSKLDQSKLARLQEIKMRLNEARKMNNAAVLEEEKKMNDPNYEKIQKAKKWQEKKKEIEEENKFKGIDEGKDYLTYTALKSETIAGQKKKKTNETFGWDVFNEDTLFNSYKKRLKTMPHYKEVYDKQQEGDEEKPSQERLQRLVDDLKAQEEKRSKFSRRRTHYEEEDITHINDRNAVFNKKLERTYGKYAAETKLNLERGTALD